MEHLICEVFEFAAFHGQVMGMEWETNWRTLQLEFISRGLGLAPL